ncbi:hypothetical protein E4U28_005458 [Claviceps purpurea]|nr:hypothetical protein E4U28_005458 [Claviceps purpurea]
MHADFAIPIQHFHWAMSNPSNLCHLQKSSGQEHRDTFKPAYHLLVSALPQPRSATPAGIKDHSFHGKGAQASAARFPRPANMTRVLLTILVVELVAQFINAVGASQINDLIWTLINYLPISTSKAAAEQRRLQADYLKIRRELNATSSQDEFARWAKLRRQHDKLLEQLDAAKKGLEVARSQFDKYLTAIRMLVTKVPQYIVPFWYGKEPMFWLPYGWFPYYAEWIISFPRAPLGSVSAPSWQLACSGVLTLLSEIIIFIGKQLFTQTKTKVPMPVSATKASKTSTQSKEKLEAKKEL